MNKYSETRATYYQINKEYLQSKNRAWKKTPKGIFSLQKTNAKFRGIPWELTFEEWWSIWQESGKWEQRGRLANQYQMCRYNDAGPYKKGNVKIATASENTFENYMLVGIDSLGRFNKK